MNSENKIRLALKTIYQPEDVNAMDVFRGYAVDTGLSGWHCRRFGKSENIYLGSSVAEALARIEDRRYW